MDDTTSPLVWSLLCLRCGAANLKEDTTDEQKQEYKKVGIRLLLCDMCGTYQNGMR